MVFSAENRIKLVVGLGNPGTEYEKTKHNVGFDIVERLQVALPGTFAQYNGGNSIFFQGRFRGRNLYIQQPMTYMNLSGKSVAWLAKKKDILPQEIMLIYDDVDLPLGRLRLRQGGGSAGHRGVESVINELGANSFQRLRVGIGHIGKSRQIEHVLSGFSPEEQEIWTQVRTIAVDAAVMSLSQGIASAMNRFNGVFVAGDEYSEDK
jgi:PTH1 family peptidyl-tRNA hydrolase